MLALSGWENLIVYIPTILFLLIFFWQLIAGLRRGLRKSTILFINMVIAMGVVLIRTLSPIIISFQMPLALKVYQSFLIQILSIQDFLIIF